jgi:transposase
MKLEDLKGFVAFDPGAVTFNSLFSDKSYWEVAQVHGKRQPGRKRKKRWRIPKHPNPPDPPPRVSNTQTKEAHLIHVREIKKKGTAKRISGPLLVDAYRIQSLQSQLDRSDKKVPGQPGYLSPRQRANRNKLIRKLRDRIKHVVDDIHRKLIAMMINKYAVILIPRFNVSGMIGRGPSRKMGKKSVANLVTWCHYRFRQRLIKAAKFSATSVVEVNESYTSKICTGCGSLNDNLGGNRVFHCDRCGITLPRDANGARNILIRFLLRYVEGHEFLTRSKLEKKRTGSGAR